MKTPNLFRTPNPPPTGFNIEKQVPIPSLERRITEAHKTLAPTTAEKQQTKTSTPPPKWKSTTSIDKPTNLLLLSGYGRSTTRNELRRLLNPDDNPNTKIHPSKNLTTLAFYDSISAASKVKQTIDNARLGSILLIYLTLTPTIHNHDITIYKHSGWNKNLNKRINKGTEIKKLLKQLEREQEQLKPHQTNLPNYDSISEARNSKKIAHFLAGDSLMNDCWSEVCKKIENEQPLIQHSPTEVDIKEIIDQNQLIPTNTSIPSTLKPNTNQQVKPTQMGSEKSPIAHMQELRTTQARELIKYRNQVRTLQHTRLQRRQRLQATNDRLTTRPKPPSTSDHKTRDDPRAALYAFQDPSPTKQPTTNPITTKTTQPIVGHPCFNDPTLVIPPPETNTSKAQTQVSQDSQTQMTTSIPGINSNTNEHGTESYRSTNLKLSPPKLLTPQEILMPPKHNDLTPKTSNSTLLTLNQTSSFGTLKSRIDSIQTSHLREPSPRHKPKPTQSSTPTTSPPESTETDSPRNSHNNTNQQTPPPQTTFSPGTFIQHLISLFLQLFNWGWEGHKQRTHR